MRGGTVYGATDDLGYYAVDKVATFYDFYATILNLLASITKSSPTVSAAATSASPTSMAM